MEDGTSYIFREQREDCETAKERARYICMTMCSIHPEAGEGEVGTLSTDRLTGLHGERERENRYAL